MEQVNISFQRRKILKEGSLRLKKGLNVLVGGNGSGKSSLLESIYINNISKEDVKIAVYSSGQNQNYSEFHNTFLLGKRDELNEGKEINPNSFYFDISWSPLLIILAIILKGMDEAQDENGAKHFTPKGLCSNYLMKNGYKLDGLYFKMNLPKFYLDIIDRNEDFISTVFVQLVDYFLDIDSANTKKPLKERSISIDKLSESNLDDNFSPIIGNQLYISIEKALELIPKATKREKIVQLLTFFQVASINDSYLSMNSFGINVKRSSETFRNLDISDGEYQLLNTFAILDIFSDYFDYIILDEVDSHVHVSNLVPLWEALNKVEATVAITSTHSPISLKYVSPERITSLSKGIPLAGLSGLSELQNIFDGVYTSKRTVALSFKNSETLVLIDGIKDWVILTKLFKKIKGTSYNSRFDEISPYALSSTKNNDKNKIDSKDNFVEFIKNTFLQEFADGGYENIKLKNIICIKDRDNESLKDRYQNSGNMHVIKDEEEITLSNRKKIKVTKIFLHRREIENYLLCPTIIPNISADDWSVKDYTGQEITKEEYHQKISNEEFISTLDCKKTLNPFFCNIGDNFKMEDRGFKENKLDLFLETIPNEEISPYVALLHDYIIRRL
ncbi:hypothetical protein [Halobacteriovorax sp. ZH1_bin.1]|uniref:hypothetical protein n=1 Tax=Halobacteriovorax sp. ZH1_bin.1 TaxID=3157723 RepID=UPI00371C952B